MLKNNIIDLFYFYENVTINKKTILTEAETFSFLSKSTDLSDKEITEYINSLKYTLEHVVISFEEDHIPDSIIGFYETSYIH